MSEIPQPLTILIGCDTFPPDVNGAAVFAKRLAVALKKRGHDVHIVAPSPFGHRSTHLEIHDGEELTVHRLYSWRWLPHPWLRFALPWRINANARRVVEKVRPDVIHFQSPIVVGRGLALAAKRRRNRIRVVGTSHLIAENIALHLTILPPLLLRALVVSQWRSAARVFGLSDAVTTPNLWSAEYLEHMTGLRGVYPISNGIDKSAFSPRTGPRSENRIVFVGRLDEEKHVEELLRAVALLDAVLDVTVDIVGVGEDGLRLRRLARVRGIADRVVFHGRLSDERVRQILSAGAVFVMPSRAELQCIAVMEAMASGLPVVAANAMALPHLVRQGENGYLYEPGDTTELAAYITRILTAEQEDYESMRRASLHIIDSHKLSTTVDAYEALYLDTPLPGEGGSRTWQQEVEELLPATVTPLSREAVEWLARLPRVARRANAAETSSFDDGAS